jgi:hypothetical protein
MTTIDSEGHKDRQSVPLRPEGGVSPVIQIWTRLTDSLRIVENMRHEITRLHYLTYIGADLDIYRGGSTQL